MIRFSTLGALAALSIAPGCFFSIADVERSALAGGGGLAGASPQSAGAQASGEGGALPVLDDPVELASGQERPTSLAQDDDDLYWTAADGVHRGAKSGEPAWLMKVTAGTELHGLVVDDTWVYFADAANARIAKVEKQGGFAQAVVSADAPFALASDGRALFYGTAAGGVFSVEKDGSGVRQLYQREVSQLGDIADLAVAGDYLVFGDTQARRVFAVPKDGSAAALELAKVTTAVFGVAVLDSMVYFREGSQTAGVLASVPLNGGARTDLLLDEPGAGALVAADGRMFFANDVVGAARLRAFDVDASEAVTLAAARSSVGALQIDSVAIYFTEPEAGKVMKVAR